YTFSNNSSYSYAYSSHGYLNLDRNKGTFTYSLTQSNWTGVDNFSYRLSDGLGATSGIATLSIKVGLKPPSANIDSYSIGHDRTLSVPAPGVLGNDVYTYLDPATVQLVSDVRHGTLNLRPDGSFSYTPQPGYYS